MRSIGRAAVCTVFHISAHSRVDIRSGQCADSGSDSGAVVYRGCIEIRKTSRRKSDPGVGTDAGNADPADYRLCGRLYYF